MIEFYMVCAAVLFTAGAGAGFLALVALGIRREERDYSMTISTPSKIARGARVANGMHARQPGVLYEPTYYKHRQSSQADRDW
jgi:hypothetical protein